jgi:hypothetical protein
MSYLITYGGLGHRCSKKLGLPSNLDLKNGAIHRARFSVWGKRFYSKRNLVVRLALPRYRGLANMNVNVNIRTATSSHLL